MAFNRFDMEQAILQAWETDSDLDNIIAQFDKGTINSERFSELVKSSAQLNDFKMALLWEMFEQGIKEKKIL